MPDGSWILWAALALGCSPLADIPPLVGNPPSRATTQLCSAYCTRLTECAADSAGPTCVADCQEILASPAQQRATGFTRDAVSNYMKAPCDNR